MWLGFRFPAVAGAVRVDHFKKFDSLCIEPAMAATCGLLFTHSSQCKLLRRQAIHNAATRRAGSSRQFSSVRAKAQPSPEEMQKQLDAVMKDTEVSIWCKQAFQAWDISRPQDRTLHCCIAQMLLRSMHI